MAKTLFEKLGGLETLKKVHKRFYDLAYKDPWFGKYLETLPQEIIEDKQNKFMMKAMGGPNEYTGTHPKYAHAYMWIPEELFDLRHSLLEQAITENGVPEELKEAWLKIDKSFKSAIVHEKLEDCQSRFITGYIMAFDKDGTDLWKKKKEEDESSS